MVRTGPNVDKDQRPKVNDRHSIRIDRTLGRLRHEVIHDAQNRGGQEERHRVVPIPPLHQRILHAAKERVAVQEARWDREVINDVEHRHGDDRRDVEPDAHVEGRFTPTSEGPEKIHRKHDPDERDRDVDRPDKFAVFLAAGETERERDRRRDDDQLPAPEVQLRQKIARQPGLHEPLRRIVHAREHHVAHKGEDHGVGVQRTNPTKRQPRHIEVQLPVAKLGGDHHTDQHAHGPPEHGGQEKLADDLVVEFDGYFLVGHNGKKKQG